MEEVRAELRAQGNQRLATMLIAQQLGAFLAEQWRGPMPPESTDTMDLVVAGFDQGMPYGDL